MKRLLNNNQKTILMALIMMAALVFTVSSNAALVNYSQNFEGLNHADSSALGKDGWLILANVPAPNNGAGYSTITLGKSGPAQGAQQLTVFSDYLNTDHADGKWVEALVYQEQTISAADVGSIWNFTFDVKQGDQMSDSSSYAFLKTLNSTFTTASELILNTTALGADWSTRKLSLEIDNSLVGQLLQFGFSSTATNYAPSGVLYDNINFSSPSSVPLPGAVWLMISGFIGLLGLGRRKC